jgi:hypothetical protein
MSTEHLNETLLAQKLLWCDKALQASDQIFTTLDSKHQCDFCERQVRNLHMRGEQLYCAICYADTFCNIVIEGDEAKYVLKTSVDQTLTSEQIERREITVDKSIDQILGCL